MSEKTMKEKIDNAIKIAKGILPALTNQHADMQKAAQAVLNLAYTKDINAAFSKPAEEMDEELTFVLGRVRPNLGATEMQQVTQAAMHLMQAKQILIPGKTTPSKKGTGA
jgi:hypothetical protein|tara:strand:- start:71 stop:400 length:330 start_codon:yes stop_codon:yes gene_type:complete